MWPMMMNSGSAGAYFWELDIYDSVLQKQNKHLIGEKEWGTVSVHISVSMSTFYRILLYKFISGH